MPHHSRRTPARVAAVLLTVVLGGVSACSNDSTDDPAADSGRRPAPLSNSPKDSAGAAPEGGAVPAYWVTDSPAGTRLAREFAAVDGEQLTAAARLIAGGGEPLDPDYRTLWPKVDISSVTATDGVLLVEISGDGFTERPDGMTRREARLAIQQLVHTLQGVQQERVPVRFQRDDGATLFGLPTDAAYRNANALRTLNLINITSPVESEIVTGDSLRVTGVANSFEASGPCRLLRGSREVATIAYQADGWMERRLFPFNIEISLTGLPRGAMTLRCEADDPSGRARGTAVDTKSIIVK